MNDISIILSIGILGVIVHLFPQWVVYQERQTVLELCREESSPVDIQQLCQEVIKDVISP